MEINWAILLPAMALLLYPLDRLLPAYMKCRTGDALADPAARHRRKWWRWQPELWADVVRIAIAAWFVDFALVTGANTEASDIVTTLAVGLILVVGLCCQMPTRREEEGVLAPLSYLLGVMFALETLAAAVATFALATAALLAFRSYLGFFLIGALVTGGLTWLLGGDLITGALMTLLHLVPVLGCFLLERELMLPVRNRVEGRKIPVPVR